MRIRTSRVIGAAVVVAVVGLTPTLAQAATPKAGGSCKAKQVGSSATSGSTNLECKKSGKAGRWVLHRKAGREVRHQRFDQP